ncbi:hypothetical protein A2U01_0117648, partial [Trifolium medium]|nr:hypothetical protein [Trifolium medium]
YGKRMASMLTHQWNHPDVEGAGR